jgi:trehalose utilization protein
MALVALAVVAGPAHLRAAQPGSGPVRVVVWDERQPAQKEAYDNFLGNAIADHLRARTSAAGQPRFAVRSVSLDDPEQGLAKEVLDDCDVLIWWGHARHGEVTPETGKALAQRIQEGRLSLLALHSAHWSTPFFEAMNARSIQDALNSLPAAERPKAQIKAIPAERRLARADEPLTPSFSKSLNAAGAPVLEVRLPMCVFPVVRNDATPSHVRILRKDHPIAQGVPETFDIPHTEIYGGPFHVPTPDAVICEERWDTGESFPSGCLWSLGAGKVFYFRPGHETYPIFKQSAPLRIVENAAWWMGHAVAARAAAGTGVEQRER